VAGCPAPTPAASPRRRRCGLVAPPAAPDDAHPVGHRGARRHGVGRPAFLCAPAGRAAALVQALLHVLITESFEGLLCSGMRSCAACIGYGACAFHGVSTWRASSGMRAPTLHNLPPVGTRAQTGAPAPPCERTCSARPLVVPAYGSGDACLCAARASLCAHPRPRPRPRPKPRRAARQPPGYCWQLFTSEMRKHHGSQSAPKLLAYLVGRGAAAGAASGGGGVGGNGVAPPAAHTDSEGALGELPGACKLRAVGRVRCSTRLLSCAASRQAPVWAGRMALADA